MVELTRVPNEITDKTCRSGILTCQGKSYEHQFDTTATEVPNFSRLNFNPDGWPIYLVDHKPNNYFVRIDIFLDYTNIHE